MTISSIGYAGSVTFAQWPLLVGGQMAPYGIMGGPGDLKVSAGTADRELLVQPGVVGGQGILDTSDAVVSLVGGVVASGSRWDMVVLRRDWALASSTLMLIPGGSSKALPSRQMTPGLKDDQPIALVRFAAGQAAVQEIVDLRCWQGPGGCVAADGMVRDYIDRIGTRLWVAGISWIRAVNTSGVAVWLPDSVYVGSTPPPYVEGLAYIKVP